MESSATINIMRTVSFLDGEVNAAGLKFNYYHYSRSNCFSLFLLFHFLVYVAGVLFIDINAKGSTEFSSAGGVCRVTGPGTISLSGSGGSFICEGHLAIGGGT